MRYERSMLRLGALAMLSLLAVGTVLAAPGRLALPRITEPGFHTLDPRPGLLPLGIGKPNGLAFIESWVTSDLVTDDYTTYPFWYDSENISIFLAFFTVKTVNTSISIQIKNESGETVYSGADSEVFDPPGLIGGTVPVGMLVEGNYKVMVKIKQGTKTVGQQYWMFVYADPGT